ncbi:MAG: thioredoxin domain-containing protein, partial [Candidatus Competibacter sp.]|nr:thioredoxin domain-containing protein [Candidatus Competibacter sp.]
DAPLIAARRQLLEQFDPIHGGFGGAPKFPHPTYLERLLRHWAASTRRGPADAQAGSAALFSLNKMALGGLYDQLGGGFYRYSVDGEWQIPHFEKMLYDNGPLLALYAQAWRATGEPPFKRIAEETAEWAMREMQAPEGGYYATLDADSEGEEGKFYLWTREQAQALLNADEYAAFAARYGLDRPPNFEQHAWHLRVADTSDAAAPYDARMNAARRTLFEHRGQRVWPGRDEKILTAWNGLMIRSMAIAGRHLGRADWVTSAERALDFIRSALWRDGRLLAVHMAGQSRLNAYLDDHAFLIDGILELLQCRWRDGDLDFALALADVLLDHFEDREAGGFFFTSSDHERLIQRPKAAHDDAVPAGNGVAVQVLLKLGHLTGQTTYLDAAERALRWAWPTLEHMPSACNAMLAGLEDYLEPGQTVVLRGEAAALEPWRARCAQPYAPSRLTLAIPLDAALPASLAERRAGPAPVTAHVCGGLHCLPPITALEELERELIPAEIAGA